MNEQELHRQFRERYFTWLVEVCGWLGLPREAAADLVEDPSWLGCFDDKMSAGAAATKFLVVVVEELPQGKALLAKWPQLRTRIASKT